MGVRMIRQEWINDLFLTAVLQFIDRFPKDSLLSLRLLFVLRRD